ncbi:Phosphatidylinositol 5-phosphate 4-kinase type-2 alpha [Thoreauomyces humboldtii]|nr:Phosphatidylinositol 5-phosphate 4-kinase type-2 alpha [Thoreauomyces humboldtii]
MSERPSKSDRSSIGRKGGRTSMGRASGSRATAAAHGKRLAEACSTRSKVHGQFFGDLDQVDVDVFASIRAPIAPLPAVLSQDLGRKRQSMPEVESPRVELSNPFENIAGVAPSAEPNEITIPSGLEASDRVPDDVSEHQRPYRPRRMTRSMMDVSERSNSNSERLSSVLTTSPIGDGPSPLRQFPAPNTRNPRRKTSAVVHTRSSNSIRRKSGASGLSESSVTAATAPLLKKSNIPSAYFTAEHTHEWSISGYGRIKFTDYAPIAFKAVRSLFDYTFAEVDESLARASIVEMSAGKSDSGRPHSHLGIHISLSYLITCILVFFSTHNKRFLLKTLRGSELENLKSFLPTYVSHIIQNPSTLLPRYLGLYTFERTSGGPAPTLQVASAGRQRGADVEEALGTKFTVVLMAHAFDTTLDIATRYDFKGSNVGRQTLNSDNPGFVAPISQLGHEVTLKEMDFQRLLQAGKARKITVGPESKQRMMDQLRQDVDLLRKWDFMDYSILIDEASVPSQHDTSIPFHKRCHGGFRGLNLPEDDEIEHEIYFIGLIDVLQKYNMIKWLERNIIKRPIFHQAARSITTSDIPNSLANIFSDYATSTTSASPVTPTCGIPGPSQSPSPVNDGESPPLAVQRTWTYPTPKTSPEKPDPTGLSLPPHQQQPIVVILPGMQNSENSVEEPGRYAERFMGFVDGVLE